MNRISTAALSFFFASGALALTGCNNNNDDSNVSAHDDCNCACRAPLIGRAECVPGPAPMVEAAPKAPVAEARPAPVIAEATPPAPTTTPAPARAPAPVQAPPRIERADDVVYYRASAPARRERMGKMRTGEIESQ